MMTGDVIVGRPDGTSMVCTPLPGMLKVIVSVPAAVLASVMAWRSDPAPLSAVLVTVYVVAVAPAAQSDRIKAIRAERTRSASDLMVFPRSLRATGMTPASSPTGGFLRPLPKYDAGTQDVSKGHPTPTAETWPSMHTRSRHVKQLRAWWGCTALWSNPATKTP
jgi:hypothetical protein